MLLSFGSTDARAAKAFVEGAAAAAVSVARDRAARPTCVSLAGIVAGSVYYGLGKGALVCTLASHISIASA